LRVDNSKVAAQRAMQWKGGDRSPEPNVP